MSDHHHAAASPPLASGTDHARDHAGAATQPHSDHVHDYDHSHAGHNHGIGGHVHAPANFGRAFAIGIGLNTAFVLVEAGAGVYGHSVALLADAGHNVSDILGLMVAWLAQSLAQRVPSQRFTYGLRGSSILAALFNAIFLLVVVGALSLEAIQRLFAPEPVAGGTVMIVAAIGVAINGLTAYLFASGRHNDINIKGAYMHMAADALVSVGVIAAGAVILLTGWLWVDPVVSLVVNAIIVAGTWGLLRDSVSMSMQAVPPSIEPAKVRRFLLDRPGVATLHDLHIWPMSTTEIAITAHLCMPAGHPGDHFLSETAVTLRDTFGIGHMTVQIEVSEDNRCLLAQDGAI
ncbi:cation diffusion facilitator family transporter [Lichenihabitans psoromatis]|uniref:cation diffusion facilitator family transporter n=1 Tax=Lichenihabitans psoromatis TaxID=2528642 RepID=UPI00103646DA|nr:cation diffusion facilitator family transporter [Lichenihabitans psoromatis]